MDDEDYEKRIRKFIGPALAGKLSVHPNKNSLIKDSKEWTTDEELKTYFTSALESVQTLPISFEGLIKKQDARIEINPHVITRARKRYALRVNSALIEMNPKLALEIYEDTLTLPQTATENDLILKGYQINGPLIAHNEELLICFDENSVPSVLKALKPQEFNRMKAIEDLKLSSKHIIKFKLITSNGKFFVIMPLLPVTLESLKVLTDQSMERFWNQMCDALTCLHTLGYAHMDIKPSNICINSNGDFILIDLGSVAKFGNKSASTLAYIPKDLKNYGTSNKSVDWWMLAATLSEKGYDVGWGTGPANPTREHLCKILEEKLPQTIWNELKSKLFDNNNN